MNAKALTIIRAQDDINTEHNMKSICRAPWLSKAPDSQWIYAGSNSFITLLNCPVDISKISCIVKPSKVG